MNRLFERPELLIQRGYNRQVTFGCEEDMQILLADSVELSPVKVFIFDEPTDYFWSYSQYNTSVGIGEADGMDDAPIHGYRESSCKLKEVNWAAALNKFNTQL